MKLYHIGRGLENEIVLEDQSVSRSHAQLYVESADEIYLIDLSSTNGSFINGKQVQGRNRLQRGDQVTLGNARFDWTQYRGELKSAKVPAAHQEPIKELVNPKRKVNWVPYVGIGLVIALVVALVIGWPHLSGSTENLEGRWYSATQPEAWIEFSDESVYREGFGETTTFDQATYETTSNGELLIERAGITVLYPYERKGDELTLSKNSGPDQYQRQSE